MNYNELQNWLDNLKKIPVRPPKKRTLMDITGIKHHENLWSDIYQFFFTINEEHLLGDLFIRSLESLIGIKPGYLESFSVTREFSVNEKRIDLLLCDNRNGRAIIIENKVNHILNNDLNLYYTIVQDKGYSDVIVIVLGLQRYNLKLYKRANKIPSDKLFSITHQDLMVEIGKVLPEYKKDANLQHLYLLQEFSQNITNKTNDMNTDEINFYFKDDNRKKINQLSEIKRHVIEYISDSLENKEILKPLLRKYNLALDVDKCKNNEYIYFPYKGYDGHIMITLVYDRLWNFDKNGSRIQAILEIQGDMIDWVEKNESNKSMEGLKKYQKFWHYSSCDIPFSLDELTSNFQENLCKKLSDETICPIYTIGLEIIEKHKLTQK